MDYARLLPDGFESLRPWQADAIDQIVESEKRFVFLDAPTGTGKTLIAEMARLTQGYSGLYVCTTKNLQDQFCASFPYAVKLMGRSNYPTLNDPARNCGECLNTKANPKACRYCVAESDEDSFMLVTCPYSERFQSALSAKLAVVNSSLFFKLRPILDRGDSQESRDMLIIDEADCLEDVIYGIDDVTIDGIWKKDNESFASYVDRCIKELTEQLKEAETKAEEAEIDSKLKRLNQAKQYPSDYIVDQGQTIKGLNVSRPFHSWIGDRFKKILLMSGSFISIPDYAKQFSIKEYDVVTVPNKLPTYPIRCHPSIRISHKSTDQDYDTLLGMIGEIIDKHRGERIIIHTVSFNLARKIKLRYPKTISYGVGLTKDKAIEKYLANPGSVLVGPSIDRGVDFPGDDCRVQIIAKIPFPYLGNARTQKLKAQIKNWYQIKTVRSLIQMAGRGMRGPDDHQKVYVLDSSLKNLPVKLFPKYWMQCVAGK